MASSNMTAEAGSSSAAYGTIAPSSRRDHPSKRSQYWTFATEASSLLSSLQIPQYPTEIYTAPETTAQLAIYLYALHILHTPPRSGVGNTATESGDGAAIRARVVDEIEKARLSEQLTRHLKDLLDNLKYPPEEDEEGVGGQGDESGDELIEMLWRPWPVDESKCACAMDLLIPPYSNPSSSFLLAHPIVSAALHSAWQFGLPPRPLTPSRRLSTIQTIHVRLRSSITPRRVHFYHLVSFFVLYGLCLALSLKPGRLITPYNPDPTTSGPLGESVRVERAKPGVLEILALTWIGSDLGMTLIHRRNFARLAFLAPLYLVIPAFLLKPQSAFALLTTSIPSLSTLLILPHYPSIALLSATSNTPTSPLSPLYLSCTLSSALYRLARPFFLLSPLVLVLFAVFSYAMNGDLSRGFVSVSSHITRTGTMALPVEEGVAPYQTRLALLVSILLLLVYGIILGGITISARLGHSDSGPEPLISRAGRMKFAQAVISGLGKSRLSTSISARGRTGHGADADEESRLIPEHAADTHGAEMAPYRTLGPPICPAPLDQLFLPLDLAHAAARIAGRMGWVETEIWQRWVEDAAEWMAVMMVGPLCAILIPIEWALDLLHWD